MSRLSDEQQGDTPMRLADVLIYAATQQTPPPSGGANDWLPYVLGAGGAGFLATLIKFILDLRSNAETRESKAIANLERWRDDADERADTCLRRLDQQRNCTAYWQTYAANLVHALTLAGIEVPAPPGPPPTID